MKFERFTVRETYLCERTATGSTHSDIALRSPLQSRENGYRRRLHEGKEKRRKHAVLCLKLRSRQLLSVRQDNKIRTSPPTDRLQVAASLTSFIATCLGRTLCCYCSCRNYQEGTRLAFNCKYSHATKSPALGFTLTNTSSNLKKYNQAQPTAQCALAA